MNSSSSLDITNLGLNLNDLADHSNFICSEYYTPTAAVAPSSSGYSFFSSPSIHSPPFLSSFPNELQDASAAPSSSQTNISSSSRLSSDYMPPHNARITIRLSGANNPQNSRGIVLSLPDNYDNLYQTAVKFLCVSLKLDQAQFSSNELSIRIYLNCAGEILPGCFSLLRDGDIVEAVLIDDRNITGLVRYNANLAVPSATQTLSNSSSPMPGLFSTHINPRCITDQSVATISSHLTASSCFSSSSNSSTIADNSQMAAKKRKRDEESISPVLSSNKEPVLAVDSCILSPYSTTKNSSLCASPFTGNSFAGPNNSFIPNEPASSSALHLTNANSLIEALQLLQQKQEQRPLLHHSAVTASSPINLFQAHSNLAAAVNTNLFEELQKFRQNLSLLSAKNPAAAASILNNKSDNLLQVLNVLQSQREAKSAAALKTLFQQPQHNQNLAC
jgi:hypothetical protein